MPLTFLHEDILPAARATVVQGKDMTDLCVGIDIGIKFSTDPLLELFVILILGCSGT